MARTVPRSRTAKVSATKAVKVTAAKGRPMLTWVGKRPLRSVTAFPAQEVERFAVDGALADIDWSDWPEKYPRAGLLFHGDNKEVLAHLLANGFRGKIDLIYIDPPFDSGADYVRRVQLRGVTGTARLDGEGYTLGEQLQYTDIWANDTYLQFMYERLLLLKELLSPGGTIWVHLDWHRDAQIRLVLDEVFGQANFTNEVIWWYFNKMQGNVNRFASNHDVLLVYRHGPGATYHAVTEERPEVVRQLKRVWDAKKGSLVNARDADGNLIYVESGGRSLDDVWRFSALQPADPERLDFPTQKPEDLLSVIIGSTSDPGDVVLDCFVGSGTTAVSAQKLGRRWIGCDINKAAIQTTAKRVIDAIGSTRRAMQAELISPEGSRPAQSSFVSYRVNDYDLHVQQQEVLRLVSEHMGIAPTVTDRFFDGTLGKKLARIVPFDHAIGPLDLDDVAKELRSRPKEERDVVVVGIGKELACDPWLADHNRRGTPNQIALIELRSDPKYGKFFTHQPPKAKVTVQRNGSKAIVEINDFISPTIIERLTAQEGIVAPKITDWRSMVDSVMIDADYDGSVLNVTVPPDIPEGKGDVVAGRYEVALPSKRKATVAVKITDMLGEELLTTHEV